MESKDFDDSLLGTKEYYKSLKLYCLPNVSFCCLPRLMSWDNAYQQEFTNFEDNGEVGDIWFGRKCQKNIIEWIKSCEELKPTDAVIDLGTGNGFFLITLAKEGFSSLTGLDYSENAVTFAKAIAKSKNIDHITFEVADLLKTEPKANCLQKKYKICHDKGTFDAISLMPEFEQHKHIYIMTVKDILVESGIFILTSCNWTEKQLLDHFEGDFHLKEAIPTPSFQFGGVSGSKYTTLILIK